MGKAWERVSDQQIAEAYHASGGNIHHVAEALGMHIRNIQRRCASLGLKGRGRKYGPEFTHDPVPSDKLDIEDLLKLRAEKFARKRAHEDATKLRGVNVNIRGPVGILHFGDPHVDDDGCDIVTLRKHISIIQDTPGMFGGNLGDTTNNWVGRLARLYANQSTTADEAWQIAEWFVKQVPWLYMVAGNHDMWSGAGDPLRWMLTQPDIYTPSQSRLALRFWNKREVRVNARHDFAGHSQWNPVHALMKAAQMGFRDHIFLAGHKHTSGYGMLKDAQTGIVMHCARAAGYKVIDSYQKEGGFPDQHISPCIVTVIDPEASEVGLVTVFMDAEEAAEYLTWKRQKRGYRE